MLKLLFILNTIASALVEVFSFVLLVYCVSSWFIRDPFNKFMQALSSIVDPVLNPIRKILERISFLKGIPIDFSPFIAFILCEIFLSLL